MSVDTDLRARLESLRINVEWLDEPGHDVSTRVITISSFSKRLLEYGAFLIASNAHADPETDLVQTAAGGYCLRYRQNPESALSKALCGDRSASDSALDIELVPAEDQGENLGRRG
jgi:hypothetical protein